MLHIYSHFDCLVLLETANFAYISLGMSDVDWIIIEKNNFLIEKKDGIFFEKKDGWIFFL